MENFLESVLYQLDQITQHNAQGSTGRYLRVLQVCYLQTKHAEPTVPNTFNPR